MEIIAKSKYIRTSPRKLRLVARGLKKISLTQALIILEQLGKRASLPLRETIRSAVANAKNNFGLGEEVLRIKKLKIEEGPTYKRFRAVSRGRAHSIKKRTSHIIVILEGEAREAGGAGEVGVKQARKPHDALTTPDTSATLDK